MYRKSRAQFTSSEQSSADGKEGFEVYNTSGLSAVGRVCNVHANDGSSYVFQDVAEFWKHPSEPNACTLRSTSYSDGLVLPNLSDCNNASELYDASVVESVGVQQIRGEQRCVVNIKSGLSRAAYMQYEGHIRDTAVKRSNKYKALDALYQQVLLDIETTTVIRDDLKEAIITESALYNRELAAYNEVVAETRALQNQVAQLKTQVAQAQKQLEDAATTELDLINAIKAAKDSADAIRKKAKEDADAYAKKLADEAAAREAARRAAIEAAERAAAQQRAEQAAAVAAANAAAAAQAAAAAAQAAAATQAAKRCDVILYDHPNKNGVLIADYVRYPGGGNPNIGSFNDRISSFLVQPQNGASCRLTLYDQDNYGKGGNWKSWEGSGRFEYNNLEDANMDDIITSYKVDVW